MGSRNRPPGPMYTSHMRPPGKNNALVRTTLGVVSVTFWDFSVVLAKGVGNALRSSHHGSCEGQGGGATDGEQWVGRSLQPPPPPV